MGKTSLNYDPYKKYYTRPKLLAKLRSVARRAGIKVTYLALLLFYTLSDEKVPLKNKSIIVGALGYFILPVDLVPDAIIGLGFTDDLAALIAAYNAVRGSITPEIRNMAETKLEKWFPTYTRADITITDD